MIFTKEETHERDSFTDKELDEFIDSFLPYRQENRCQLNRLMEAAQNQKFDCLLIWKLDF